MKGRSKLNFFDFNPPPEDLVVDLFINRSRELKRGLQMLDGDPSCCEILAVYGPRRAGKSHFARAFIRALQKKNPAWRVITSNANRRGRARLVLEDIFVDLWKAALSLRPNIKEEDLANFDRWSEELDALRALVLGEYTERSVESQRGATSIVEGGGELKAGPASAKLGGKLELREQASERHTVRAPSDREVTESVRDVLDGLHQFDPERPILIFVDDLDRLESSRDVGASTDVSRELVEHLKSIAECDACLVMVTVGDRYFTEYDKEFNDFVSLGFLDESDLERVYRRHVEVFNEGRDVFDDEVRELLIAGSDGRAGIFLKLCRDLWKANAPDDGSPIAMSGLRAFLRDRLSEYRRRPETMHHVPVIERMLAGPTYQTAIEGDLRETPLLYNVLMPVPGQPTHYSLNPLWSRALGS